MSAGQQFSKLLEPGNIGKMTLRNRMVMPPMVTNFASEKGYVTQQTKDYYEARARGGISLIIVEATCIDASEGKTFSRQLLIDNDNFVTGMADLTEVIHRHGARAALQIHHGGRVASSEITGKKPVAPSPVPVPGGEMPRPLTGAEIAWLVTSFTQAAVRAKRAGFDGIEVHGAHGYLVSQFLSATSNKRDDQYGGSVENRTRFLLEILKAIRREVGREYPVWCRLSAIEFGVEDGITIEETIQVARMVEEAGADAIHVSVTGAGPSRTPPMALQPGRILPLAETVREAVSIPIIGVMKINPQLGESALREGKADFIAFGRALLADPDIPGKVSLARLDDIKPCIYCGNCSDTLYLSPDGINCTVNPALGIEREYRLTSATRSKKVIIVGGGPAGMEAARVTALRGHHVQLYEKELELGGQLLVAQIARYKQTIGDLTRYLSKSMENQDVEVHLATEVTPDLVAKETPDAVVLATGGSPLIPDIPGVDRDNVVLATDVLMNRAKVGDQVVIIGGELVGCEVAGFLVEAGKKVTLMRRGKELALKVSPSIRGPLLYYLSSEEKVTIMTGVQYRKITVDGVTIINREGRELFIEADTVVMAAGAKPNNELLPFLKERVSEVYAIGDCIEPRNIQAAMKEGYRIGLLL